MHIALVNRWYPPHSGYGGIAVYNYYLAHALVQLGHQVTVVATRWSPEVPAVDEDEGITVHRLLSQDHYHLRRLPLLGRYLRVSQQLLYSWQVARKLRQIEQAERLDVVEFAEINAEGFFYLRRPNRARVIVRCHTPTFVLRNYYQPAEMPYNTTLISALERFCIRRADVLTAPSHNMAQTIARTCHIPVEKIRVIPNALDVNLFAPSQRRQVTNEGRSTLDYKQGVADNLTILHVGRLDRTKGIEVLAQVIPQVLHRVPKARFVFIGDDCPDSNGSTWRRRLETYFQQQGLNGQVVFTGGVDQETLMDWYRCADIAVVPSLLYESFSYTCAQAMAAGLATIASRIGGIPETVEEGVSGLLVTPGDREELASAIIHLLQNPTLRKQMAQAGQTRAKQRFDAVQVAHQFLEIANCGTANPLPAPPFLEGGWRSAVCRQRSTGKGATR